MANRYESEKLRAGEAFVADFARANPNHPDLDYMNTDLAATRARVNLLNVLQPVAIEEQASVPAEEVAAPVERPIPNFYILRQVEGLKLPSPDQLITSARADLKTGWGRDFEVPTPPDELFETLQGFAERNIKGFDETYYLPQMQLTEGDKLWKGRGRVKPEKYFWQQIEAGNFPQEVAILQEGWYIGDRRLKPPYDNGQQRYGKDDYMEPLMAHLRDLGPDNGGIEKYDGVPDYSRFGASPREIEGVILPKFAEMSGAKGIVENRRYIEFNVRGNIAHPELGQTNTWEWFGDSVFRGARRLVGGDSDDGGLADVVDYLVGGRYGLAAFSPVVRFPSKAA